MKIGLYGIGGLYNFGCEGIVRGVTAYIRRIIPDAEIVLYSERALEDKARIEDLNIQVEQINYNFSLCNRIGNKILYFLGIQYRFGFSVFRRIVNECDALISIGGDIYTIPEHRRNQKKYAYYNKIVQFGNIAMKMNKPLVLFGASIGPFGENVNAQKYYFKHLRRIPLIIAREKECIRYLKENGINRNVVFLPDPAFLVESEDGNRIIKKKYIVFNFSKLSLVELYGNDLNHVISVLIAQISEIVKKVDWNIVFLPHVISPISNADNDLLFLEEIQEKLLPEIKQKVSIINVNSFLSAKKILQNAEIVVAARMHCAINALSCGVPTLFLSYSQKAKGMSEYVYKSNNWVLSQKELKNLSEKVSELIERHDEVDNFLISRIKEIKKEACNNGTIGRLKEVLYGAKKD